MAISVPPSGCVLLPPDCGLPPIGRPEWTAFWHRLAAIDPGRPPLWERLTRALLLRTGPTPSQRRRWEQATAGLTAPTDLHAFFGYVAACRVWYGHLVACTTTRAAEWDWHMTLARTAQVNDAEQQLGSALLRGGLAVQAQLGVSSRGGRGGGWFDNYWLDYAYRDHAHLLKIDVELDGWHHQRADRAERDEVRNERLRLRGWYVYRVPGSVVARRQQEQAVAELMKTVRAHRHAAMVAWLDNTFRQWWLGDQWQERHGDASLTPAEASLVRDLRVWLKRAGQDEAALLRHYRVTSLAELSPERRERLIARCRELVEGVRA